MMKKTILSISIILSMQSTFAQDMDQNTEEIQAANIPSEKLYSFDAKALFGGSSRDLNLSGFSSSNAVVAGTYSLNTYVNHNPLGQLTLRFEHLDANRSAVLCIDKDVLQRLDLRKDILEKLKNQDCLTIKDLSPDAYYDVDRSALTLNISLPLAIINNRPAGYIAPELFDKGVTAAFISYDFNHYNYKVEGQKENINNYLSLTGGFNFAGFNYRHAGSFDSTGSHLGRYQSYLNALSTDILPLKARVTIGDFSTQTYSIDSAQIVGAQLATDLSMRPMSQRSYAPKINGIANSNALVSVFQNGRKIYERTVPAGNFEIDDLTAIGNNGDLTVQVTENGGEKHSFIVPLQGNLNLIRVGQLNYSVASGQYKFNNTLSDDFVSQLSFEYGLTNYLSTYAGVNISQPFQSYLLGFGTNTFLGGFKFDVERAKATLAEQDYTGYKYKAEYQYAYAPLGTSLSISALRQSQEYMTLGNTMSLRNFDDLTKAEVDNLFRTYRLKQQFSVSLYQTFIDPKFGSFYLSASQNQYWNSEKNYNQYNIGYANHWKKLTYSIGFSQSANDLENNSVEKKVYLTLSMPLEWGNKRTANVYSNIQQSDTYGNPTTAYVGFTGTAGSNNELNYGVTANKNWNDFDSNSSISANLNYNLPQIQLGTVVGLSDEQEQYGFSARGAIVAHEHGLTATNTLSDTFAIVHAEGARGADVVNAWGAKVDRFGNAIYSSISPYEVNNIALDLKRLPIDVQLKSNQTEIIPRRFSSTLIEFNTEKTSNVLLQVYTKEKVQIPIGVQAKDAEGNIIGMFGQSNQLFIEKADLLNKNVVVQWGATQLQSCTIEAPAQQFKPNKQMKSFQVVKVECK